MSHSVKRKLGFSVNTQLIFRDSSIRSALDYPGYVQSQVEQWLATKENCIVRHDIFKNSETHCDHGGQTNEQRFDSPMLRIMTDGQSLNLIFLTEEIQAFSSGNVAEKLLQQLIEQPWEWWSIHADDKAN